MTRGDNLQSIARKVRALLARTQAAGCTESEALEAAAKAQELMETYQLDMSELELQEEGVCKASQPAKNESAAGGLGSAIGKYCDCKNIRTNNGKEINFLGLRSDVDLATWMMASLETFVTSESLNWMFEQDGEATRAHMESFAIGAYRRIAERLNDLTAARRGEANSSRNALVSTKGQLIRQHPDFAFFNSAVHKNYNNNTGMSHQEALRAGAAVGENANFGRPVRQAHVAQIGRSK